MLVVDKEKLKVLSNFKCVIAYEKKNTKKAKKKIMNSLIKCFQCWRLSTQYNNEKEQMENMQIKSNILIIKF